MGIDKNREVPEGFIKEGHYGIREVLIRAA